MSSTSTVSPEYLNLTSLKERGWTASLIKSFLGQPDHTKVNPFYRSAPPQKLYLVSRVEKLEGSREFQEKRESATKKSQAAKARAQAKRAALVEKVLESVHVRHVSFKELRRRALFSKAQYDQARGDYMGGHEQAEERHIHRWMVNYARHELSNYDSVRERYFGQIGVHDAAEELRSAVLKKIADQWPELKEACRQAERC